MEVSDLRNRKIHRRERPWLQSKRAKQHHHYGDGGGDATSRPVCTSNLHIQARHECEPTLTQIRDKSIHQQSAALYGINVSGLWFKDLREGEVMASSPR